MDHNETSQAVANIDEAEILEIIDHHRIGSLETIGPVYFRNQPLGCTGTIIYQMYMEKGVEVTPQMAGLMCAAILSDTLVFRSPTCTQVDKSTALILAEIAQIDVEEFAQKMFEAGSNFQGIIHLEYRRFLLFREQSSIRYRQEWCLCLTRCRWKNSLICSLLCSRIYLMSPHISSTVVQRQHQ